MLVRGAFRIEQASLVETVTNVRPGVTVQEMGFPEQEGVDGSAEPEVVRMKAGPADLQIPGRLSRSAYKVIMVVLGCVGKAHDSLVKQTRPVVKVAGHLSCSTNSLIRFSTG